MGLGNKNITESLKNPRNVIRHEKLMNHSQINLEKDSRIHFEYTTNVIGKMH